MKNDVELRNQIASLRKDQRNAQAFAEVSSTYVIIGLTLWFLKLSVTSGSPYLAIGGSIVSFFLLGFMQYRLVMSCHEAVHKTLFFPAGLNEFFGVFHASLVGISFFNYRKTHLEHHKNPQSIEDDVDSYIYRPLLETKPGIRRLALLVFGVLFDIFEKVKRKVMGVRRVRDGKEEAASNPTPFSKQMLPILLAQGSIFAFFTWQFSWWFYPIFWVTPVLLIGLGLDRARTFLEHGYMYIFSDQTFESFKEAPQTTIDINTNFFERYFFAPFGFAYHQAHHTYLTVPFYNLPKLADTLEQNDDRYFRRVKGSYIVILTKMIWANK